MFSNVNSIFELVEVLVNFSIEMKNPLVFFTHFDQNFMTLSFFKMKIKETELYFEVWVGKTKM